MAKIEKLPVKADQDRSATRGVTKHGRPYNEVLVVDDRTREGKTFSSWTKVGVAFQNRDESWLLELAAVPVNGGRLIMRAPRARREQEAA